jgi:hypothetical protein
MLLYFGSVSAFSQAQKESCRGCVLKVAVAVKDVVRAVVR